MLPNKPFNMPMPKSQLNGGSDLDEGCGDIEQAAMPAMDGVSTIPQAEGGLGLERNLRGMSVTGEQEKARRTGKFYEPSKYTTVKH
jgi:hypothetical protein